MNSRVIIFPLILILSTIPMIFSSVSTTNVVHLNAKNSWDNGVWRKKVIWKPRWVKTWKERKYFVAVWKKVWGPVELNEWVPIPKPPPGWSPHH